MFDDPIVKETHEHRQVMMDRFDGDPKALFELRSRSGR